MTVEEVERIARDHAGQGLTEVHIVGGVHPEHDLYYYVEMIRRVKGKCSMKPDFLTQLSPRQMIWTNF